MPSIAGELHCRARLADADVVAIREEYSLGRVSMSKLADRHGVTRQAISPIIGRKTRLHAEENLMAEGARSQVGFAGLEPSSWPAGSVAATAVLTEPGLVRAPAVGEELLNAA